VKNKVIGPYFLEEAAVIGDTFRAIVENTAFRHVPMGTIFQLHLAPTVIILPFWTRSFLIVG
jgi:hypothetical protein